VQDHPTIREATAADLDAVEQLLRAQPSGFASRPEEVALPRAAGRRHLLILDAPDGGLAAAALVDIDGHRGHLVMLAVAQGSEGHGLEDRMIGVAEALCKAFGADTLDVPVRDAA
jgi:ribosomal protein S18 acetylase RimI-like enzyme